MPGPARPTLAFLLLAAALLWSFAVHAQTEPASPPPTSSASAAPAPTPPAQGTLLPAGARAPAATPAPAAAPAPPSPPPSAPRIDPTQDQRDLANQGNERPTDGQIGQSPRDVYSEDWWGRVRPLLELHGYLRTRGELFHNFFLGRHDLNGIYQGAPGSTDYYWPQPLDQSYSDKGGQPHNVTLCGPLGNQACYDKTQATANMRFRIDPEIHISDNLRILSQIDMLDNLVLGSTPDAYAMQPGNGPNGYVPAGRYGYAPYGVFSTTQGPPTAGVNGYENSINVKRVWGEYMTPVGQLRFGRMPSQWGLGMLANAGDGIDSDYQSTADRIMFVTGVRSIDLYFGGAWDFVSTGPTSATPYEIYGGQPYSTANLDNVNEWVAFLAHRTSPESQRLKLARGDFVLNGGIYSVYRTQLLDVQGGQTPYTINTTAGANNNGLERRGAYAFIPDGWVQALWRKFRFEAEFAAIIGYIEYDGQANNVGKDPTAVRMFGLATQTEYRAVEDKLHLNFGFGWASGDPWVQGLNPGQNGLQPELNVNGAGPISTFRFHPDYRVDLIFFRQILTRVEGAYYFRPSVDYDFLRNANGQKFGGGGAVIWSRASEFEQTPGHKRDLGVELDLELYYQAKDGSLNDDPDKVGGFFTMLQYGVFFPLGGLSYLPGEQTNAIPNWDTSAAQTVRLFLGIVF